MNIEAESAANIYSQMPKHMSKIKLFERGENANEQDHR